MKIAVISSGVLTCPPPGYSGLEAIAWLQAEGLAARGHEVTLYAPEGSRTELAKLHVMCKPGQWDEHQMFDSYWKTLFDFECVIDHSWQKWPTTLRMENVLPAPTLNWCHAPCNTMFGSLPPGLDRPCFVCISKDQADHFRALYEHEARVCYNGCDTEFYKPLGTPRTDRFLFLGRFSTIKGPLLAIEACLEAGVGLDLIGDTSITGEPHYFEMCKAAAAKGSPGQIVIHGSCSRGDTVHWYSKAHCMIHATREYREPFGLAPVEAMLCGCPVIAWDRGALRETVKQGESGWLVRSKEELTGVVMSVAKGFDSLPQDKGIRQRCREWASQFSIESMVARVEELCVEAVQTGGW